MRKILIIEDEPAILLGLKDELSQEFEVFTAPKGQDGLKIAVDNNPDLVILDLILPDIDGFSVCKELKEKGVDSSVIMVTARDQTVDKVKGLELGADDYVTKPFDLEELKARINAVLRRRDKASIQQYRDDVLDIDFKQFRAKRKNKALKISALGFKLLRYLISRKGEVVSRDELLKQVWGYDIIPATRTVDAQIRLLRKSIGRKYIVTCHGIGYKFQP